MHAEQTQKLQTLSDEKIDLEQEVCAFKCATAKAETEEIVAKAAAGGGDDGEEAPETGEVDGVAGAAATCRANNAAKVRVHSAVAKAKARPDLSLVRKLLSPAGHVWAALQAQGVANPPSLQVLQEAMDIASRASAAEDAPDGDAAEHPEANSKKRGRVVRNGMELEGDEQEEE